MPTMYPIPVRPNNSQALSPVVFELNAITQEGSFLPATKYPATLFDSLLAQNPMASSTTPYTARTAATAVVAILGLHPLTTVFQVESRH
jgi:hypothetical protein